MFKPRCTNWNRRTIQLPTFWLEDDCYTPEPHCSLNTPQRTSVPEQMNKYQFCPRFTFSTVFNCRKTNITDWLSDLVLFQNVMFYDMGSGSTTATIVTYQTVKTKEFGTQPQLQIRGVGWVPWSLRWHLRLLVSAQCWGCVMVCCQACCLKELLKWVKTCDVREKRCGEWLEMCLGGAHTCTVPLIRSQVASSDLDCVSSDHCRSHHF